ncbi:MAG: serine--tRNA ligase [Candidatus Woesearchaeota archaeon]
MLDIKLFRNNPELIKENLKKKFQEEKIKFVDEVIFLDKKLRILIQESESMRNERNTLSIQISEFKKNKKDVSQLLKKAKNIPDKISQIEKDMDKIKNRINELLLVIPNIIDKSVPIGRNSKDNIEIEKIGEPVNPKFKIKNHAELITELGLADFESSARISGNGFYFLKGKLAQLNMALINFARDFMIGKGYTYVEPPLLIRKDVLSGVFSSVDIEQMSYFIEGEDLTLIATSEHPIVGCFKDQLINEKDLPIKITSYSMCFRKEVGSHGIDQRGLFRTHQFNKQEMVILCKPEDSQNYFNEMISLSKELFKKLEIPVRILEICSGDLGDLKAKSVDVEAWSPKLKTYFEIGSCSNLTDAQARRLNIRSKGKVGNYYVHTLNNTVIATSRVLIAIIENYQTEDGELRIPSALVPYMNGIKKISKK